MPFVWKKIEFHEFYWRHFKPKSAYLTFPFQHCITLSQINFQMAKEIKLTDRFYTIIGPILVKYWEFINKKYQYWANNHPILDKSSQCKTPDRWSNKQYVCSNLASNVSWFLEFCWKHEYFQWSSFYSIFLEFQFWIGSFPQAMKNEMK